LILIFSLEGSSALAQSAPLPGAQLIQPVGVAFKSNSKVLSSQSDTIALESNALAVAAGGIHTCALTVSGGVKCWGGNEQGQLGDGTKINRSKPVEVVGLSSGVTALAAGGGHTCALTDDGGVKCWGDNSAGQLGNGNSTDYSTLPVDVVGLSSGVTALAAGGAHTCALTTSGGVMCWGDNSFGQLGDGTANWRLSPVEVVGLPTGVTAIASGNNHTCALSTSGKVQCWGDNSFGQLGDGTNVDHSTPVDVVGLFSEVTALAAGCGHNCVLTSPWGGVRCWGQNSYGQLGDGSTQESLEPVDVNGLSSGVTTLAAGGGHTCALTLYGGVKCWGRNDNGQIGDGSTSRRLIPVDVAGLSRDMMTISNGDSHTCTLAISGGIRCWGLNGSGQLGDGTTTRLIAPVDVIGLSSGVSALTAGVGSSCALTSAGGVKCWGEFSTSQTVDGSNDWRSTPSDVDGLTSGITALFAGMPFCALTDAGGVKCWESQVNVPWLSSGMKTLALGMDYSCFLTTSGAVKCWGGNEQGQLGDGTTTDRFTPADAVGLSSGVTALAAGYNHTCALTATGAAKCWPGPNSYTPQEVPGLSSSVKAIAVGNFHNCALTAFGGVKCWGSNVYGQLGDGTSHGESSASVDVIGLSSGVTALAVGEEHTCAVTVSGGVKCWGGNSYGQLGDGTTTDRSSPVDVIRLNSSITSLAAGDLHTCALTTFGGVKCWGWNLYGQLGYKRLWVPVNVAGFEGGFPGHKNFLPLVNYLTGS
jgi:alpha-tubulin suppressor-like RCC1 family protein